METVKANQDGKIIVQIPFDNLYDAMDFHQEMIGLKEKYNQQDLDNHPWPDMVIKATAINHEMICKHVLERYAIDLQELYFKKEYPPKTGN